MNVKNPKARRGSRKSAAISERNKSGLQAVNPSRTRYEAAHTINRLSDSTEKSCKCSPTDTIPEPITRAKYPGERVRTASWNRVPKLLTVAINTHFRA